MSCSTAARGLMLPSSTAVTARVIGMPVIEKRASDLMSKWLGESEQNIARAFSEARADGAMLIFDEADSLLACLLYTSPSPRD